MQDLCKVILHPKKDRSIRLFHPWIFSGAIRKVEGSPGEGEQVDVYSSEGDFLGTGHYHEGSIKVRILSFKKEEVNVEFWKRKFDAALELRKSLGLVNSSSTNAFRLIHGEGDGLPGLIIDIYDRAAVIQTHTAGMDASIEDISMALDTLPGFRPEVMYVKQTAHTKKSSQLAEPGKFMKGNAADTEIVENDVRFYVNWVDGQKTGFFLDQRENRLLLSHYARNKRVLNTFSYSGGFSMYALKAGAKHVDSVDSSGKAAEWAQRNTKLNEAEQLHLFHQSDAFDFLKQEKDPYDLIVLDPPAFAKHLNSVDKATIGYRNLNLAGFRQIARGGILFTFSCSQVIDRQLFRKIVFQAAAQSGRNVRILHQLTQGPDHPVSIYHPEGEYLKGLVLWVD